MRCLHIGCPGVPRCPPVLPPFRSRDSVEDRQSAIQCRTRRMHAGQGRNFKVDTGQSHYLTKGSAMKARVVRIGHSRGIRISKSIIEQCHLHGAVELQVPIPPKAGNPQDSFPPMKFVIPRKMKLGIKMAISGRRHSTEEAMALVARSCRETHTPDRGKVPQQSEHLAGCLLKRKDRRTRANPPSPSL